MSFACLSEARPRVDQTDTQTQLPFQGFQRAQRLYLLNFIQLKAKTWGIAVCAKATEFLNYYDTALHPQSQGVAAPFEQMKTHDNYAQHINVLKTLEVCLLL